ncbi:LacI family DNA-binding transcriptional regulator [Mycoplasmopsis columbina]|uniref:LacI family DNA-binding transcriptional regulator n=1 Tax=Mycoplasmopsis columbina TaxID=114881 RepID=UPI0004A6CDDC|nr:LacI family DNA-binding transcriptional regulator [Mycoplasmopsis columbina]VEU77077.1 LacI family transcriptional regulator [Mycoplasmopsis columbina]
MKEFGYKEIAKLTGLSVATVSRYFNECYISDKNKELIEDALQKKEYVPSLGNKVIKDRDNTIFAILPETPSEAYYRVLEGIQFGARRKNKKIFVSYSSNQNFVKEIKNILSWKPFGVIVFMPPNLEEMIKKYIEQNRPRKTKIFLYNNYLDGDKKITIDYGEAFKNLVFKFKNIMKETDTLVYVDDIHLKEKYRVERRNGFINGCELEKINCVILELDWKQDAKVKEVAQSIFKSGYVYTASSSHDVFMALATVGDKNMVLTDIGSPSNIDHLNKYSFKILEDFVKLGLIIERNLYDLVNDDLKNQVVVYTPDVIKKGK